MASDKIDSNLITLINQWGVSPVTQFDIPKDGFTGDANHNASTDIVGVGTCVQVKHPGVLGVAGYSQFMYFKWVEHSGVVIAVKAICVPASATVPFTVTNDPDAQRVTKTTGRLAVAISTMTTTYYGWGWVGGVCPEDLVPGLGGTYETDTTLVAGFFKVGDMSGDYLGFTSAETTGTGASTLMAAPCGFAQAANVSGYA
jgi:hypothetical protein